MIGNTDWDKTWNGLWRINDGENFKFGFKDKAKALSECERLGGTAIGLAHWNESKQQLEYRQVMAVKQLVTA